jgi:hypothetical protein
MAEPDPEPLPSTLEMAGVGGPQPTKQPREGPEPDSRPGAEDAKDMSTLPPFPPAVGARLPAGAATARAEGSLSAIEEACEDFEVAREAGRPEPIEHFLPPPEDPRYLVTLEELVKIEMERAWKATRTAGEKGPAERPPLVEAYLARFPQLREGAIVCRLARQEYHVRHQHGDTPSADEYGSRFPDLDPRDLPTGPPPAGRPPPGPPAQVPGYEIVRELGRGGMGVVYQARHLGLKRLVALKMIRDDILVSQEQLARFRIETEALARLKHPNIVTVYEVVEHAGRPCFAVEFAEGGSLKDQLLEGPLTLDRVVDLV